MQHKHSSLSMIKMKTKHMVEINEVIIDVRKNLTVKKEIWISEWFKNGNQTMRNSVKKWTREMQRNASVDQVENRYF